MIIKIKNYDKYMKKHQVYYYNNCVPDKEYDVYSIIDDGQKVFYLIYGNDIILYIAKRDVIILDDTIPKNWVNCEFKKGNTMEDASGEVKVYIKRYFGPEEFINDTSFLADVASFNYFEALKTFKKYLKTNTNDLIR